MQLQGSHSKAHLKNSFCLDAFSLPLLSYHPFLLMEPIPESSREGESTETTLIDDLITFSPQSQVIGGQSYMSLEHMEQCSSDGCSHPLNMASPIPSEFELLVISPNLQRQEGNYPGSNQEPSSLGSFPSATLGLATQEPGQSSCQAEIISTRPNQPETSLHQRGLLDGGNTSGEQGWNHPDQSWPIPRPQNPIPYSAMGLGGNDFDQTSRVPRPQTPFPCSAMGLGVGHGGNEFDQTSRIPQPQNSFPHSAIELGGGHGGHHLTDQQLENLVTLNQTNQAYSGTHQSIGEAPSIPNVLNAQYSEAPIRSHQFFDESPVLPIALDAQYSSSVTPQQASPIWSHAISQLQINDQVLMDTSNASTQAAVNESILLPDTSVPYWQSRYQGEQVQPNQLPLLDVDPHSHYSTMHDTSVAGPLYSASFQSANQAPLVQNFVDNSDAGTVFLPAASSITQWVPFTSPLGFPNETPPIIPNSNAGQSQFMDPEMDGGNYSIGNPYHLQTMDSYSEQASRKRGRFDDSTNEEGQSSSSAKHFRLDGITQDESHPWLTLGHANSSSQPQGNSSGEIINSSGGIINRVYDPMYEHLGLPIDPHMRMFLTSQWGNPSRSRQTATSQSDNQPRPWRAPRR